MNFPRASGILLHLTSLPGQFGIGDLGSGAYRFADFLMVAGQHLWQMLPLGPTGYGNSPYQCLSVFAGNPLLISLEKLAEDNLLEPADLKNTPSFPEHNVDFNAVIACKLPLLKKSFEIFMAADNPTAHKQYEAFCAQNASWIDVYSLFMALKEAHGLAAWNTWEEDIRKRESESLERWRANLSYEVQCHKYYQYQFFKQWTELKKYCNERGIRLIGDIPIFVAFDSAEVWSHQEMFYLDTSGKPLVVAGVPPDYFSETGQLWSNPLYRWDVMARDGYAWWVKRFQALRSLVDIIRLDHFRGLEKYWEILGTDTTARNGRWVPGPGAELFEAVQRALGTLPIIAEDLGFITTEVDALRERFGFPGMRVLQFAFGDGPKADYHKPHSYPRNCVVYTGTHDNNTTIGWFRGDDVSSTTQSKEERKKETQLVLEYLGSDGREFNWDFIRLALMSVADTAIIPPARCSGVG
ncbi:MAG: 4-alpha-glucanotransferase [Chloroflexota bacterium]